LGKELSQDKQKTSLELVFLYLQFIIDFDERLHSRYLLPTAIDIQSVTSKKH